SRPRARTDRGKPRRPQGDGSRVSSGSRDRPRWRRGPDGRGRSRWSVRRRRPAVGPIRPSGGPDGTRRPGGRLDGPRGPSPEGEDLADPGRRRLRRRRDQTTKRGLRRRTFRDLDFPEGDAVSRRSLRGCAPRLHGGRTPPRRTRRGDSALPRDPGRCRVLHGRTSEGGVAARRFAPRSLRGFERRRRVAASIRRRLGPRPFLRDGAKNPRVGGVARRGQSKGDIFHGPIERQRRSRMKAVVLAAGEGTRMRPLTANLPKPLLPVAGKPFLRHSLEALRAAGIRDLAILIGWQGHRIRERFGDGAALDRSIAYEEQNERLGTAHAIGCMRSHVEGPFLSVNGDVVVSGQALSELLAFHGKVRGPVMALAEVPDPSAFGVVEMKDGKVSSLEEKPRKPKSHLINAGIYVFDEGIFPLIDATPKSPRGEFEITDTIRLLMAKRDVYGFRLPTEWIDVGRPWDLLQANAALLASTHVPHQNYVGDSILGERCNLGAGTKVANLRLDEAAVKVVFRGVEVDTGLRKLGVIMGDDVKVGINASIDAGTIVGEESFLGPGAHARGNIAPRSRIF